MANDPAASNALTPDRDSSATGGDLYIGLMSGTSLDGVDGVLATIAKDGDGMPIRLISHAHIPFADELRRELLALQIPCPDEIHREAQAANALARCYANCIQRLLHDSATEPDAVRAVGVHGQTIRHRPELGYTRQINNPSLLAELCGIDVIADFRSRDIAAGGQGAPLVPAFHRAAFGSNDELRVVANIGGIANITVLERSGEAVGFDTGPGNVLMDIWIGRHLGRPFDGAGSWAASGTVIPGLLQRLCADPYFGKPPPKSTGRDLFNVDWLTSHLATLPTPQRPEDVQRTLCELTAITLADGIRASSPDVRAVFVCGGGACNDFLMQRIQATLDRIGVRARVLTTEALGVATAHVEAMAFAWLARQFVTRRPGNLPRVTGAHGPRLLGALYPA